MTALRIDRQGAVAVVSFDRGTPANPLSLALMRDLTAAARSFEEDYDTAAVILTGRADNFAMGFDLKDAETRAMLDAPLAQRRAALTLGARMCQAWQDIPALTIAAIEGWCVGGGVALAAACDFRVIGAGGAFYVPELERGFNMSWGSVPRLINLMGVARAKRVILLAEQLPADRAEAWGLADRVAPNGQAVVAARDWAAQAGAMPQVPLRMAKRAMDAYANALAQVSAHADADQFALAADSADGREAVAAFLDKRPPRFTGG